MASACISWSKTACWDLPASLARYMAVSASRSSSSAVRPTLPPSAMPMLALTTSSCPSIRRGSESWFWMRSATHNYAEVAVYAAILAVLLGWRVFVRLRRRPVAAG